MFAQRIAVSLLTELIPSFHRTDQLRIDYVDVPTACIRHGLQMGQFTASSSSAGITNQLQGRGFFLTLRPCHLGDKLQGRY